MLHWSASRVAPWRMTVVSAVIVLVSSACGSTVQWSDTIAQGESGEAITEDGLSVNVPGATPGKTSRKTQAEDPNALADAATTQQPGTSGTQRGEGTTVAPPGAAPPPGASGRGYTAKEIYIGYGTAKQADEAMSNAGFAVDVGDQEAQAKAAAKIINDRGGMAGRKVIPVFHDWDISEGVARPDSAAQRACEAWTVDRQVFAVINILPYGDKTLTACLAKRTTPYIALQANILRPDSIYTRHAPYFYAPVDASIDRLVPRWIARGVTTGYFEGGWDIDPTRPGREPTKIGILTQKQFYSTEFTQIVQQELNRRSVQVAANYTVSQAVQSDEQTQAVVRFRDAGVTHVISAGSELTFFMQAAESQNYRPRYLMFSGHAPQVLQKRSPKAQLVGSMGVGYFPAADVDNSRDPGDVSTAQARCRKAMEDAGESFSSRDTMVIATRACDAFSFVATAIEEGALSPEGMYRGVQDIDRLAAASTFSIAFRDRHQDGAAAVRDLAYHDSCDCYMYTSKKNHGM